MNSLHCLDATCVVNIISITSEKFIYISIGVLVKEYMVKNGQKQQVFEYLRFIDSFQFMPESLDRVVQNLPSDKFHFLEKHVEKRRMKGYVTLLKRKGHYPYGYTTSIDKFYETSLSPHSNWINSPSNGEVSVTEEEYKEVCRVFFLYSRVKILVNIMIFISWLIRYFC